MIEPSLEPVNVKQPDTDDIRMWSVTTIIDVLHKEAIIYWACEQTAEAAIDSHSTWRAMLEDQGRDETLKWLRDARRRLPKTRLSDANRGTLMHKLCETYAITGDKPGEDHIAELVKSLGSTQTDVVAEIDLCATMLNHFDDWAARYQPAYQGAEVCVYSPTYGYAGQCDGFLTINGVRYIIDYKSTRKPRDSSGRPKTPYPDQNALQLAAYRNAEFAAVWRPRRFEKQFRRYYLLSPEERARAVPVPEVDTGLVILLTPESCSGWPMECGPQVHNQFLYCLENTRWVQQESKTVMGEPLE